MKSIIVILKGVKQMKLTSALKWFRLNAKEKDNQGRGDKHTSVFGSIVRREFTDYIRSWRIIILLIIIALTCLGSLYTAVVTINDFSSESESAKEIAKDSY